MKKRLLLLLIALSLCHSARAQALVTLNLVAATADCITNPCLVAQIGGNFGGATLSLAGTWVATLQFEATANGGATWVALSVTPSNSTTTVTSATADGTWQVNVAGYTAIRIRPSLYTSGTIIAAINPSIASARGGSGAGAGGTVTNVSASSPITSSGGATPNIACATCVTGSGGGSISGSSPQVAVFTGTNTIGGDSQFTWNTATHQMVVDGGAAPTIPSVVVKSNSIATTPTGLVTIEGDGPTNASTGSPTLLNIIAKTNGTDGILFQTNANANLFTEMAQTVASGFSIASTSDNFVSNSVIHMTNAGGINLVSKTGQSIELGNNVGADTPLQLDGSGGGSSQIGVAAAAGTPNRMNLPTATGGANTFLKTDGGNPQQLSWATPSTVATAVPFSGITSATNTTATMTIGNGATINGAAGGLVDLTSLTAVGGFKVPAVAGAVPTADGNVAFNTTTHALVSGSNGTTIVQAAAATATNTSTTCTNQFFTVISSVAAPTCTTATLASAQFANQGTTTTVLHGNGAGNPSFAAIVGADMTNNTVTATQLATQYSTWLACDGKGLGDGLNAIPAGTYLQYTCKNISGVTVTITGVQCLTDNNGTSTLNASGNTLGALLTGAVTCTTTYAAGTQSTNVALTSNDYIKFTFVADGTSKQTDWVVTGTY